MPYTFWGNGAFLPGAPTVANHNPTFAPAIQPTLRTGTEAAIAATLAYVGKRLGQSRTRKCPKGTRYRRDSALMAELPRCWVGRGCGWAPSQGVPADPRRVAAKTAGRPTSRRRPRTLPELPDPGWRVGIGVGGSRLGRSPTRKRPQGLDGDAVRRTLFRTGRIEKACAAA